MPSKARCIIIKGDWRSDDKRMATPTPTPPDPIMNTAKTVTDRDNRDVCLVIPTYNEADNIARMLRRVLALDDHWQVLIADDRSPDGTADVVEEFRAECPRVHLSSGEKRGLGAAYKRGMSVALEQLGADIVVQMDADFSHDPAEALRLVQLVRAGADAAIGSRYVEGASIDAGWHIFRRWLSTGGNWLARRIAGIRGVRDCTAGFRAIRRQALEKIAHGQLPVNGYAFQIALLHQLVYHDLRVVEHPIHFSDRAHGETKLGLSDLLEFFASVWMLRFPSAWTFTKFFLTGLSGILVNLSLFLLMIEFGAHKYIASPIAVEISILWNFFLNNHWTFAHRQLLGNKLVRGVRFNAVSFGTLLISFAAFITLSALLPSWSPAIHQTIAIVPAALFNYFINSYWTFAERARGETDNSTPSPTRLEGARESGSRRSC